MLRAASTEAARAEDVDVLAVERLAARLPPWRTILHYRRHWTVQNEFVGITVATGAPYRQAWRDVLVDDNEVQVAHGLAHELEVESLLVGATPAATEAARLETLYGVVGGRRAWCITGPLTAALAAAIEIGSVVRLQLPRFGLDAGKLLTVIAVEWDPRHERIALEAWG